LGSKTEVAALRRDVCFEAVNGLKSDIAPCPFRADTVAKVPKAAAAKFPPKNETSDNRRSIEQQTRCQNRL
jgi:hypothetical protein